MPELIGDDVQGHASHRQPARICMAQDMKADRRLDASRLACLAHGPDLVAVSPCFSAVVGEQEINAAFAGRHTCEKLLPLFSQKDVAGFAGF